MDEPPPGLDDLPDICDEIQPSRPRRYLEGESVPVTGLFGRRLAVYDWDLDCSSVITPGTKFLKLRIWLDGRWAVTTTTASEVREFVEEWEKRHGRRPFRLVIRRLNRKYICTKE
jgi:hypothetical protein